MDSSQVNSVRKLREHLQHLRQPRLPLHAGDGVGHGHRLLQLGGSAGAPVVEERSNVRQGNRAAVAHPNQSVAQGDIAPELCKGVRALLPAVFLQHLEQTQEPFALCEPAAGRRRLGRRSMMVKLGEFSRGMSCL